MSKMIESEGYDKLLEPDVKKKPAATRKTKMIYIVCCVLAAVSVTVLIMSLCQITLSLKFMESIRGKQAHLRPAFSNVLQTQPSNSGVHVDSGALKTSWPDPPPHDEVARVARYIVHISDWASIATYSVAPIIEGYPFANILSLSDGPVDQSSGTPYMYLTPMDLTSHDLKNDSRASLSMTEAQSDYCHKHNYDPESPLCSRILITGHIVKVDKDSAEEAFARNAVFSRHPEMKDWPVGHSWYFAKMNITHIYLLDYFGGASEVNVQDYFEANPF